MQTEPIQFLRSLKPLFLNGVGEYELIQRLQAEGIIADAALRESLGLFRCHFVLFNALYRLRDEWLNDQTGCLTIHTLNIQLHSYDSGAQALTAEDNLRSYYLDLTQLNKTGEEEVDALLASFWQRFGNFHSTIIQMDLNEARIVLGLTEQQATDAFSVKRQYRKLQHQHHPDKGGTPEQSQRLQAAYESLLDNIKSL